MKKNIFTIMIALAMLITIIPVEVFASDVIDTEEELIAALEAGGEVTLGGNIELSDVVYIDNDLILDFNGYTITTTEHFDEITYYYSCGDLYIGTINQCEVIFKNSKENGGIVDDQVCGGISIFDGTCTIENCEIYRIDAHSGKLYLKGSEIGYVYTYDSPYVNISDDTFVKTWDIGLSTLNFDPSEYLEVGYGVIDNGDGTYTVQHVRIEETGEKYTVYYYDWESKNNRYDIGDGTNFAPAEQLILEIYNVCGNADDILSIPMTKVDEDGKLWSVEFDIAYINAVMHFANNDAEISTGLLNLPEKDGLMFSNEDNWTIYGMNDIISGLEDEIESYDKETISEDDKATIEDIIDEIDSYLAEEQYLSDAQEEKLNILKEKAEELLEVINTGDANETDRPGDTSNLMLCLIVMSLSIIGIIVSIKCKKIIITT